LDERRNRTAVKDTQSLCIAVVNGKFCTSKAALCALSCALVFSCTILASGEIATAQQSTNLQGRREQLELQKLRLEVKKLSEDRHQVPGWLTAVLGVLVGAAGTAATIWGAQRARRGALDQSVHEKRLELYPDLVNAAADLALYFPPGKSIDQNECRAMGRALRAWYFEGGGLLMSAETREAYFALARALTRASLAEDLSVPLFPKDAESISEKKVDEYRKELAAFNLDDVENWSFGGSKSKVEKPGFRFKDFVFLQKLSSTLRSRLCEDLHSRRRPD
jgi:hypothetical protein